MYKCKKKNMRKICIYLLLIGLISSCDYKNEHESYKSPEKSTTLLYKEASSMKGLSLFYIGKTTINDLLKIKKEIKKDSRYGSYYLGSWIGDDFEKKDNENTCPNIEIYKISKYFIGEIEISYLELYFYKDTLYEIHCWTSDILRDAFTKKYGEGVKIKSRDLTGKGKNKNLKSAENITWENDSIIATYDSSIESIGSSIISYTHDFVITTKMKIINEIDDCIQKEYQKKENEKNKKEKESINKIWELKTENKFHDAAKALLTTPVGADLQFVWIRIYRIREFTE